MPPALEVLCQVDLSSTNLDRLRIRAQIDMPLRMTAAEQSDNVCLKPSSSVSDSARVGTRASAAEPPSRRKIIRRGIGLFMLSSIAREHE